MFLRAHAGLSLCSPWFCLGWGRRGHEKTGAPSLSPPHPASPFHPKRGWAIPRSPPDLALYHSGLWGLPFVAPFVARVLVFALDLGHPWGGHRGLRGLPFWPAWVSRFACHPLQPPLPLRTIGRNRSCGGATKAQPPTIHPPAHAHAHTLQTSEREAQGRPDSASALFAGLESLSPPTPTLCIHMASPRSPTSSKARQPDSPPPRPKTARHPPTHTHTPYSTTQREDARGESHPLPDETMSTAASSSSPIVRA